MTAFTAEQLTLKPGSPGFEKIRYVLQGNLQLPGVQEINLKTRQAKLANGQLAYFTELRDHVGDKLRLVDLLGTSV